MRLMQLVCAWSVASSACLAFEPPAETPPADPRNIRTGHVIPDEGYCDQPYVVITKDGNWLCLLTTAGGREGATDQHVVSTVSTDRGRTWSELVELESADGPESAYVVPLITPGGRVYAFYDYNGDNFRCPARSDCVGWYVYRFSDDGGRSWSPQRYRLPMRTTAVDRTNTFGGKVQIFWGIGKPITTGETMIFSFSKCGKYLIDRSEGWFFRSDNVLAERDPAKIRWQLLPDGDVGLMNPELGEVQAEQNIVALSDGSIYCMYRTIRGYPCHAYSRDGAHTWTMPEFATYTPGGKRMKNPRACPRIWRCNSGKFLFWFHNHSGKTYEGRNPAWIAGGIERDGTIHWSQPEILLYDPDPKMKMSYPDLVEQDGRYWVTETNKTEARVHEIDAGLLEGLWNQGQIKTLTTAGLAATFRAGGEPTDRIAMPVLPDLEAGGGFSVEFWVALNRLTPGKVILDGRNAAGKGIAVTTAAKGTVRIELGDGRETARWDSDPATLRPNRLTHVAIIVDGGPKIITFVVDGMLCDGGTARQYGWGRFPGGLGNVNGLKTAKILSSAAGAPGLKCLRIYDRYLRTSEAIANYHAGPEG